jgi:FlaA1/EpsC-like NDP-sugar epimerase
LSAKITNTPIGSQYFILGLIILVKIISFYIFNLYNRLWRYISTNELFTQFSSVIAATLAFFLLVYSSSFKSIFGISFYIVDFFITLSGIIFARLSYRILRESFSNISSIKTKKTLIYGAGDAGNLLLKELMQSNKYSFRPVGWIDDDVTKKNMILGGLKVYGGEKELKSIIFKTGAEVVIISSKLFDDNRMNRVRNILDSSSIELGVFNIDLIFNNAIT